MFREPQRIIQEVLFNDDLGSLTAQRLLSMPRVEWEALRARLTDHRSGKPGLVARCMACDGEVYIRTTSEGRPLFAHYEGADPSCPWYSRRNLHPHAVRAAQYSGQQESKAHRRMCELIAELCELDHRCVSAVVDKYLAPTDSDYGRYPDVLIDWQGFGKFAVEYQKSHSFQTEISQRCIHYEREGIPLLWVLSSFDPSRAIPQPISDVMHRHRGNAFVLDQAAITESRRQETLVLTCFMRNGDGFDAPVLVRFDALTFPEDRLPFLEDRLVRPLLQRIAARRRPVVDALRARKSPHDDLPIEELRPFPERWRVARLVAAAFSIVAEAAGKPQNFASKDKNIRAMLNNYFNHGSLDPYALLLAQLIKNTSQRALLKDTVGDHLRRSLERHGEQVDEKSPEWELLRELLPEALDPFTRKLLKDAGALPAWAS